MENRWSRAEQQGGQCNCDLLLGTPSREAADASATLELTLYTIPAQASCLQSDNSQLFGLCIDLVARTNCSFFHKCRCWSLLHFKHSHVRTMLLCIEYKRRETIHPFTVMRPVAGRNISLAEPQQKCQAYWTLLEITDFKQLRLSWVKKKHGSMHMGIWFTEQWNLESADLEWNWILISLEKLTRYISAFILRFLTVLEAWY